MNEYHDFNSFKNSTSGWFYDQKELLTFIKLTSSTSIRNVLMEGVNSAPYEAEFAELQNVTTNDNHANYYGTGFVDGFANIGDLVTFDVYSEHSGQYNLTLRYSAGAFDAQRTVYVNNLNVGKILLDKTTNWDTWSDKTIQVTLNKGKNKIKIKYDNGDYTGINIDNISLN